MTQWSTYTPYDTSYMPSDVDQVDSTRLKAMRIMCVAIIAGCGLLLASPFVLVGMLTLAGW